MHETRRRLLLSTYKALDLGLLIFAFIGATLSTYRQSQAVTLSSFLSMRVKLSNLIIFLLVLWLWHLIFNLCGLYTSKRLSSRLGELRDALIATIFTTLCVWATGAVFAIQMITPQFVLAFGGFAALFVVGTRLVLRGVLSSVRLHGHNLRFILILGTNRRAMEFARKLEAHQAWGYRIVGFVDEVWEKTGEFEAQGFHRVCDFSRLAEFLRGHVVDEVANFLPLGSYYANAAEVADLCGKHGILLRMDSDLFGRAKTRAAFDEMEGSHHLTAHNGMVEGWPVVVKRVLDVIGASILLILAFPVLAVSALLIKFTSKGPIFFTQDRVGLNKRVFRMFKFRTMVQDAEGMLAKLESKNEAGGPVFKIKSDPRITPIGKILRRTSVDELPQLWNILKGDMSLVGPRPLPIRDYKGFSEDWHRRRFAVRPGLTCLWQVNGRSGIKFDEWMMLDIKYLDEWSLWLDLKILVLTIPAVFRGSGAF